jgi:oxygen-independent coproporphyrinogen III oxidase
VSVESLDGFRRAGVNRVSFGVQSFLDDELRRLSRLHGADRARQAFTEARAAGFDNVSLDLMMWLPGQRVTDWLASVEAATALGPEHLSLYMLEVYPNAPLKEEMARRAWSQAPDADVADMYVAAMERLESAGYEQYEISNVARPGHRSRHNLKYWSDGAWYGFGCGAHSTVDGTRWKNVAGTDDYIERIARDADVSGERRQMTPDEQLGDALFTGLRLLEGVDIPVVNARYQTDVWQKYGAELRPFVEAGILVVDDQRWRLTREGCLVAHEVMAVFV